MSKRPTKYFTKLLKMYGAEKNVDGALGEKEMGSLVENYVWKIKVVELRLFECGEFFD
jgi:hypothetical protein